MPPPITNGVFWSLCLWNGSIPPPQSTGSMLALSKCTENEQHNTSKSLSSCRLVHPNTSGIPFFRNSAQSLCPGRNAKSIYIRTPVFSSAFRIKATNCVSVWLISFGSKCPGCKIQTLNSVSSHSGLPKFRVSFPFK